MRQLVGVALMLTLAVCGGSLAGLGPPHSGTPATITIVSGNGQSDAPDPFGQYLGNVPSAYIGAHIITWTFSAKMVP